MIQLALLGPVSLTGPVGPFARRAVQRRRIALLAVLAGSSHEALSRDRIVGLLWPESDDRTARHLLAGSVYVLRRALGADAIVSSDDELRLSSDHVRADIAEFRRSLAAERWADALCLYRGDFLDGFFVRNASEFERWASSERARLHADALSAASAHTRALELAGRMGEAVAVAERAFDLAPCDEAVFRQLFTLLLATDNRARAEAASRGFVERLAVELGIAPSPQTMRMIGETRGPEGSEPIVVVAPRRARRSSRSRPLDSTTANIIAQGRHHWQQRTRPAVLRSIDYFSRAVERDAHAVDAWSGLADAWVVMAGRGFAPVDDAAPRAAQYAERALALDDGRSGAHASLGGVNIMRRRWDEVESALRRAIQIDPRNADARHWLAMTLLTAFGKRDEALREQTVAAQMHPLAPIQVGTVGWLRYLGGEFELSKLAHEPAADLNGEVEEGHAGVARAAARLGDEAGVRSAITAGLSRRLESRGDLLAEYASALAVLGDTRRARRIALAASARGAAPMKLALAWASLGDANRTFSWLGRESFLVSWTPQAVWWDPRFDAFRDDARFARVRQAAAMSWRPDWL
ncbi:MAG: BTAD domain-containing putative transcriptional regulator [Gemmatimonas sp.]